MIRVIALWWKGTASWAGLGAGLHAVGWRVRRAPGAVWLAWVDYEVGWLYRLGLGDRFIDSSLGSPYCSNQTTNWSCTPCPARPAPHNDRWRGSCADWGGAAVVVVRLPTHALLSTRCSRVPVSCSCLSFSFRCFYFLIVFSSSLPTAVASTQRGGQWPHVIEPNWSRARLYVTLLSAGCMFSFFSATCLHAVE
jgi:hypothetical protein